MTFNKRLFMLFGLIVSMLFTSPVIAAEDTADTYPSIIDIAGSGVAADDQPEIE